MAGSFRCTIPGTRERLPAEGILLRSDNVFQLWLYLNSGKARSIPAAAQRLDEEHARYQPLPVNHGQLLLVVQQVLLGVDDIQIIYKPADVAAVRDVYRGPRSVNCLLLSPS